MEQGSPKSGDCIALTWKKEDGSFWGCTEGYVLGIFEDNCSQPYLVLDRSTYDNSLKSALYTLGLLDLWIVPTSEIEVIVDLDQKERPPNIIERLRLKMEIDYKSNIDYEGTRVKLNEKGGCRVISNQPSQTDGSCTFNVQDIEGIEEATVGFSPKGNIQIHCLPKQLNECINWLEGSVEIQPGHKHLVLIPTNFMLNIHDIFKEKAEPSEETIERIAQTGDDKTTVFPLGWAHYFFDDLERNPLRFLFPEASEIREKVLNVKKNKEPVESSTDKNFEPNVTIPQNSKFYKRQEIISKYLASEAPIMEMCGEILKPEDENGLKNMWLSSRPYPWSWLDTGNFHGKMLLRDLTINKKTGIYSVHFRKYFGTGFTSNKR